MRKHIRFLVVAVAAVAAIAMPFNASAICGSAIVFGQSAGLLTTPSADTASVRSNFWVLDGSNPSAQIGNPTIGVGADNGNQPDNNTINPWVRPYQGSLYVVGDWAGNPGYDGCPDISVPTVANQRMLFAFSDVSGSAAVFAVTCLHRTVTVTNQFDIDTTTGGGNLVLTALPKAAITNTVRAGNEATITVGSPDFSGNYHSDGSVGCALAQVIPQYDVYKQELARNATAPTARDAGAAAGTWLLVGTANVGSTFTFTTTCATTNCDVYLAVAPHLQGGFTTGEAATGQPARVGTNSNKVQAGPILADTPNFKIIKNPGAGARPKSNQ